MSSPGERMYRFKARTFLLELGRETTIRDDQVSLAANQQHRGIAGEPGQIADVRGRTHEERLDSASSQHDLSLSRRDWKSVHYQSPPPPPQSPAATTPVAAATAPVPPPRPSHLRRQRLRRRRRPRMCRRRDRRLRRRWHHLLGPEPRSSRECSPRPPSRSCRGGHRQTGHRASCRQVRLRFLPSCSRRNRRLARHSRRRRNIRPASHSRSRRSHATCDNPGPAER